MRWFIGFAIVVVVLVGVRLYMVYNPDAFTGRLRGEGVIINIGTDCTVDSGECYVTVKDTRDRVYKLIVGGRMCHTVLPLGDLVAGDLVAFYGYKIGDTVYQQSLDVCSSDYYYVNKKSV